MGSSIFHNQHAVEEAVNKSSSMKDAITYLGLRPAGGNYKSLRKACIRFELTVPKASGLFQTEKARSVSRKADSEVFVEESSYTNRSLIKKRMYSLGVPPQCSLCGLSPSWQEKPLTLQLDHINGIANDNRLENLRILCPNCHSQTSTFCGGNK